MKRLATLMLMTGALALMGLPAHADRAPTADERTRIEAQLRSLGYTSWEAIELDEDDGRDSRRQIVP